MTLYSIVPEETVWEGMDRHHPEYMEVRVNGILMQVERINASQAKIVRIYSCNANDFINPAYAPGTMLEFQPLLG